MHSPDPNKKARIVAVGLGADEFRKISPLLDLDHYSIDRLPTASSAIELIQHLPIEVLLVRHPLPGMTTEAFLDALREPSTTTFRSSVIVLTTSEHLLVADGLVGHGANRVVLLDHSTQSIRDAVANLLHVAPRKRSRFLAQLEFMQGRSRDAIVCLAHNSSSTGVLLETDRKLAAGTMVDFEFNLPECDRPIAGIGQVVRQTTPTEKVEGLGMRFLSFAGDSQRAFDQFLQQGRPLRRPSVAS